MAAVTWLKDGMEIRRSKRHEIGSLGYTHTLTVRNAQTLDSAIYSCRVGAEGQDFPVQVEGQWPEPSPLRTPCLLGFHLRACRQWPGEDSGGAQGAQS